MCLLKQGFIYLQLYQNIMNVHRVQIQNQMASLSISPAGYPTNFAAAAPADQYQLNWGTSQPSQAPYQMSANVNH